MIKLGNWRKSYEHLNLFLKILWQESSSHEELGRTLRMPNVCDLFLLSLFQNVINLCRQVIDTHLLLVKVPEFLLLGRIVDMPHGVCIASIVAHPDVMPFSRQHESQSPIF